MLSRATTMKSASFFSSSNTPTNSTEKKNIYFAYTIYIDTYAVHSAIQIYLKLSKVKLNKMMTIYMHDLNTNAKMAIKWHKIAHTHKHSSCKHRLHLFAEKLYVCVHCMRIWWYRTRTLNLNSFKFGMRMRHTYTSLFYTQTNVHHNHKGFQNENDQFVNLVFK